jgi:protein-disulfide isomerase
MGKRIFILVLVVAVGVLLGLNIVAKQARDPLLRELLNRQTAILQTQKNIEKALASQQGAGSPAVEGSQRQKTLEDRVAALESKLEGLSRVLQQVQRVPAQMPPQPPPEDLTTVYNIPVNHTPVMGKNKAPVTIVEFLDFQCPFCARFHEPMLEAIKAYPGKVGYMVKNFPLSFHPQARPAAKAAFAAAQQGKYEEMVNGLLKNGQNLSEDTFKNVAKEIGLNVDQFLKDYQGRDQEWEKYIEADISLGSKVGVRGTPSFYINGRKTNARDVNGWKSEIDKILKEGK